MLYRGTAYFPFCRRITDDQLGVGDNALIHVLNTEDDITLTILYKNFDALIHVLNTEDDVIHRITEHFNCFALIHVLNTEDDFPASTIDLLMRML